MIASEQARAPARMVMAWVVSGQPPDTAAKDDQSARLMQVGQALDQGQAIWLSLTASNPSIDVLELARETGSISFPTQLFSQVMEAWGRYRLRIEAHAGLGLSPLDAFRARAVAGERKAKAPVAWNPATMGKELESLAKAEVSSPPPGAFGSPAGVAPEVSQASGTMQQIAQAQEQQPEQPAMADPRELAHHLATAQEDSDGGQENSMANRWQSLRDGVVKALDHFQSHAKGLEALKESDPTAYKAMMGLLQQLLDVASEMAEPVQKSEQSAPGVSHDQMTRAHRLLWALRSTGDLSECCARGRCRSIAVAAYHALPPGHDWKLHAVMSPDGAGHWYLHSQGQTLDPTDAVSGHDPAVDPEQSPTMTPAAWLALAQVDPSLILDRGLGAYLAKSQPMPVGTQRDAGDSTRSLVGRIKVSHGSGAEGWLQARSGKVQAVADRFAPPIGGHASHPISSRNVAGH